MKTFVIIPCHNEHQRLASTCSSLGFGDGRSIDNSEINLVLVDNASTDGTAEVMAQIREASRPSNVFIVSEPTRGYVSARHAGANQVMEVVRQCSLSAEATLVLQADADTIYLPGYINAMRASCSRRPGEMLEGSAITGRLFSEKFREFDTLCRSVDYGIEFFFAQDDAQVVVDDKVCGYLLSDYLDWGGHKNEFDHSGQEIFAETTRMFMRGKKTGLVRKIKVDAASAIPSRRKLRTQALAYFASAGFPRNAEWVNSWGSLSKLSSDFLVSPYTCPSLELAIKSRQRHLIAFFSLLPEISQKNAVNDPTIAAIASRLRAQAADNPGQILGTLLELADEQDGVLATLLDRQSHLLPKFN